MVEALLETVMPRKRLIADKAYDAGRPRDWLKQHNVEPVIP